MQAHTNACTTINTLSNRHLWEIMTAGTISNEMLNLVMMPA